MADLKKKEIRVSLVLLPDKRVRTITIYILYKYTRLVEHYELH